jgi:DNA-binding HxlR family transcriptional regulator
MALRVRRNKVPSPPTCPLTECMALLRGAWAPNVIWYLSVQPRRFGELRVDMPKISARVLSARLRELEDKGVVSRRVLPTSPPSVEYELTELGRELVPAIQAIVRVGVKLKLRDGEREHDRPHRRPSRPRGQAAGLPAAQDAIHP